MDTDLEHLRRVAEAQGREVAVAAVVLDGAGRVFTPRRSAVTGMLPGLWDLPGGHVEQGETILEALAREVHEETGWSVRGSPTLLHVGDWAAPDGKRTRRHREFDFAVDVDGDLEAPRLRPDEHSDFRWVGPADLDLFDENLDRDGGLIRHIVEVALRGARRGELTFPHATLFPTPDVATTVDVWRRAYDPAMAAQIGPHVTVASPRQVSDVERLRARVAEAAREVAPFRLRLGRPYHGGDPAEGVALGIDDLDGGWRALHDLITGEARAHDATPHLTVVHPRTSGLGAIAWSRLADADPPALVFDVSSVAVTAFDGRRWPTVVEAPLTG